MAKKTSKKSPNELSKTASQVYALLYAGIGVILCIAFGGHLLGVADAILGKWFGSALSEGFFILFGAPLSFLFPVSCFYIGWLHLHHHQPTVKTSLLLVALLFAGTTLMAIPDLSKLAIESYTPTENLLGHLIVYLMSFGFGTATFGPYFIVSLTLVISLVALFDLDLKELYASFKSWWTAAMENVSLPSLPKRKEQKENPKVVKPKSESEAVEVLPYDEPPVMNEEPRAPAEDYTFIPPEITAYKPEPSVAVAEVEIVQEPIIDDAIDEVPLEEADISEASLADPSLLEGSANSSETMNSTGIIAELEEEEEPPKPYELPSIDVLLDPPSGENVIDRQWIDSKSLILIKTLEEFRLKGCRVSRVNPGPVVTQFEIELAPGIPVRKITSLQDDLALKLGGKAIRIQAPIPGKPAVGIEIPNDTREVVYFKDILKSPAFLNGSEKLPVVIGKSIAGVPLVEDISKMPHLLIAGQTGAGKSVGINSFIATLLLSKKPDELRMIMIDPKKVEMACYEGIPHLMSPVVTEPEKAVAALQWAVREMESRYRTLAKVGAKNLESFNKRYDDGKLDKFVKDEVIEASDNKRLPYVVIIVDELADLMMTAAKDVEALIQRIAQLARAVGIHLIVATQRPSVDIITGPIKANLTSRISFRTIQSQDSRTILGSIGAEKLLGMGDMLYLKNGAPDIQRYHGAYISEEDVERLVKEIKSQGVEYNKIHFEAAPATGGNKGGGGGSSEDRDELFEEAARLIITNGLASTSGVQRRLSVGYSRAGRIMDQLCDAGIVGPPQGSKAREILITKEQFQEMLEEGTV